MEEKLSYKSKPNVKKKFAPVTPLSERLKNRLRYRKNKYKIKLYNKKWRQRNKMQIKRKNQRKKLDQKYKRAV